MAEDLTILPMRPADLDVAIEWAAAEGWNPGLDDAAAFLDTDPDGFLMGWIGDQPVACVSVVRHSASFGFLGFYICHPDHRGQGHGWALWQAGLSHLGGRTVGLDGVPDQEENYRRSGFEFAFRTHRFEGNITGRKHAAFVLAEPYDLPAMVELDTTVHGVERAGFVRAWTRTTDHRLTLVSRDDDCIRAMGTIRACRVGHKIGPLLAPDISTASALIESLAAVSGATRIAVDIPEPNVIGCALAKKLSLASAFQCARMYKGPAPRTNIDLIVGLASFELG